MPSSRSWRRRSSVCSRSLRRAIDSPLPLRSLASVANPSVEPASRAPIRPVVSFVLESMPECAREPSLAAGWRRLGPLPRAVVIDKRGCYGAVSVSRAEPAVTEGTGSEDAELVAAMSRGDAGALGALYDRHASHMFALAKRIV